MSGPYWIDPHDEHSPFPDVELALREPDGLLAVGGNLSVQRLIRAYRQGIFPWYSEGQPILWWSPDPRMVLFPERFHVSRSLKRTLNRGLYTVSLDEAFDDVIHGCAGSRRGQNGTWLTPEMIDAYRTLHAHSLAHSVEVWWQDRLVGGVYGVALGRVFFGESMFSRRDDASKVGLLCLCRQLHAWGFGMIDCQMRSDHLISLGAEDIPRRRFIALLQRYSREYPLRPGPWRFDLAADALPVTTPQRPATRPS